MRRRIRRLLDIRPDEGTPVLLTFLYIAVVVASFLLAKPIRNGLFLKAFGAYNLVYVYVAVPVVLALFVPLYGRVASVCGQRRVIAASLVFFALNVLGFWYAFTFRPFAALPAVFYVWVNCYGIIAPVQAWMVANSLFDVRQARRLFGVIGAGASLGAISGGLLARILVEPLGGAINLLLVLALLILIGAVLVTVLARRVRRVGPVSARVPFKETLTRIASTPYLRLLAATVFLVSIAGQWTGFQFSLAATQRFAADADRLTEFFGVFNFSMGIVALLIQLFLTGPVLRRFGISVTIFILPIGLLIGSVGILMLPVLGTVLLANGLDQGVRFSVDKATYELLYLPISPAVRSQVKSTIDIMVSRLADAVGGVLLGLMTQGFFVGGLGLGLRGVAAANLGLVGVWFAVAFMVKPGYVSAIRESIRAHRLTVERASSSVLDRSAAELLTAKLTTTDPEEILYALDLLEPELRHTPQPIVRVLLQHSSAEVRRRALTILRAAEDTLAIPQVEPLLSDPELDIRTEALLFLAQHTRLDPITRIQELGDFPDFSIRGGIIAFLSHPGPRQNLDAARVFLDTIVTDASKEGRRARLEAARLLQFLPHEFGTHLGRLLHDPDVEVARHAIRAVGALSATEFVEPVIERLTDSRLVTDAGHALGDLGDVVLDPLRQRLFNPATPMEIRREIPRVLVRVGSQGAQRLLMEALLQTDTDLRFRVISSLNKLSTEHRTEFAQAIETVLAAEIMGHYRSYQILGTLDVESERNEPVLRTLRQSMEQEVERIFRLLGLIHPSGEIDSVYVGVRSADRSARANALEFLENILAPSLRALLIPLVDGQVTAAERVRLANRLVGATMETREEAILALLAADDVWLCQSAIHAIGSLGLRDLEDRLDAYLEHADPTLRQAARASKRRLAGEPEWEMAPEEATWAAAAAGGLG